MSLGFLKLDRVTKLYGERTVVDKVSLELVQGEVLGVLGASGSGKTTMLRLIAGLEVPNQGEIWINNQQVATNGYNLVSPNKRKIGFVFQDLALWPHLTVAGNLNFVLASAKMPKSERIKQTAEMLKLVRIERFADSYPNKLSGGEQQRVALARALVGHPQLLLLDEPMSSLDPSLKKELQIELARLQQLLAVTTIYVTHARDEIETFAHRIAIMNEGRIEKISNWNG